MTQIGPVQMLAVGFGPDAGFEGEILNELTRLEGDNTIRILDLLFVHRDAETNQLVALDYEGQDLGGVVGALLGLESDGETAPPDGTVATSGHAFGLAQSDIDSLAASLDPGYAAAFLLIEHVWARDLKKAIRGAGGVPMGEGFLTPELVASLEPGLAS